MRASDYGTNFRAQKVDLHAFSMIPRAEIPRSSFRMQHQHKLTCSLSALVPIYLQEVLPGDSFNVNMTVFARLATPIYPLMDNMDLESYFFFVPNRLVWTHWVNFMGEQANPADSISYTIPQCTSPTSGYLVGSLQDYLGLPTVGQLVGGGTYTASNLPCRAYNLIWNQWFRDENLQNSAVVDTGDGPDTQSNYVTLNINKRHDYFTSCLPWTQKGGVAVTIPLGTQAIVKSSASELFTNQAASMILRTPGGGGVDTTHSLMFRTAGGGGDIGPTTTAATSAGGGGAVPTNLYADLSTATAATINQLRLSFQTQKLLERDARGGTRYTEIIRSHFGVISPDARLQRPEYLGGGKQQLNMAPVPQTVPSTLSGTSNPPMGQLAGVGTIATRGHGFRQSFTEHGHVIGLITVRADPIYQQGCRRLFTRSTRYDFYFPVFAMLGEQAVRNDEIYAVGSGGPAGQDAATFGFMERWAEYRYFPSQVSGQFMSTYTTPLDAWHLAEKFTTLPALNAAFISDKTGTTIARNLAVPVAGAHLLVDAFFDERVARPMPMYSVPGLIDHF